MKKKKRLSVPRRERIRQAAGEPRIESRLCRPGHDLCERIEPHAISDVLQNPGTLLWVDIRDPDAAALELLREEFGFHRLALEDAAESAQRAKVDEYPGYYFVVMHAPVPGDADDLQTVEIDLFIGRNYLVTLHAGDVPALSDSTGRWERTDPALREHVGFLVYTVMDSIIDAFFPVVDEIEDRLDDFELRMFAGEDGGSPEQVIAVKRNLYTLRKAVYPLREVFNTFLRREGSPFVEETYPYFQDVYDHVLRLLDVIDIQRDMASSTLDAHLATVSNRLNETMKRITVLAIGVTIMGAIFGAWGMNFDRVPLAHTDYGFWLLTGGTLGAVVVMLLWSWWRGWL
ncbi:MAG: corA 1 [Armatimonadetes bacterium]|jgi:magnesium transporter|nr:corA 1 [Armatimonadota bacterium]